MELVKCVVCDKEIEKSKYTHKDICSEKCFKIDYWNEKVKKKDDPRVVRIDGKHWWIGEESGHLGFKGYGGTGFKIKFFDGREVQTTSLWHNGTIPESFRELIPDNAEFIGEPAW